MKKISGTGSAPEERYSEMRKFCPLQLLFCLQHDHCVTVRPVRGHFTPEKNITFFIKNWMLNIFLFNNFFKKSSIFSGNNEKLFWEHIWQFLRERRRLAPNINGTFFITKEVLNIWLFSSFFKKKPYFLRKWQKTVSGAQVFPDAKGAFVDENEYKLFYGKWGFEYFFINNFFKKSNIFRENRGNIWGHDHFLEGAILR